MAPYRLAVRMVTNVFTVSTYTDKHDNKQTFNASELHVQYILASEGAWFHTYKVSKTPEQTPSVDGEIKATKIDKTIKCKFEYVYETPGLVRSHTSQTETVQEDESITEDC